MAYFRCATGGGAGATITVTYTSDFYGETITCSHGTKTYTKVATSSGTVDFTVDEEGTWTISCMGFSDTADVVLSYDAELVSIPDGETVLPTDDIQKWLACAGIKDKAYTTLSQVLADSETYNALLGDSNACAYMKRSTTWAVASGVPTMTSDTTPSGTASASNEESSQQAWHAFDKDDSTYAGMSPSAKSGYVQYAFDVAKEICSFTYLCSWNPVEGCTIEISCSDDDSTYTSCGTYRYESSDNGNLKLFKLDDNYGAHRYWRLTRTLDTNSRSAIATTVQFYETDITTNALAMSILGRYDVACDALLSNDTWASAIINSSYSDYVIDVKVPTMTSSTAPSGEVIYSTQYNNNSSAAFRVFDGSDSTNWSATASDSYGNMYVGYVFTSAKVVQAVSILSDDTGGGLRVKDFRVQGKNASDSDWTTLLTEEKTTNALVVFSVPNNTAYTSYRLVIDSADSTVGLDYNRIATLQFYGRTPSSEKVHGANGESAYILDGGSPVTITEPSTLDAGTYTVYSRVAKDPTNLSNDYSKTIRICPNTKDICLMPDGALYWWGNMTNACEVMSTANGWSTSNDTLVAPTLNNTSVSFAPASLQASYIASKHALDTSKLYIIGLNTTGNTYAREYATKTFNASANVIGGLDSSSLICKEFTSTPNNYMCAGTERNRAGTINAFWYE